MYMVLVIVLVNLLVAVVVFGVCILGQVLILRKEVEEVTKLVLQLKLRTAYTEAYSVAGGSGGGAGGRGAGAHGGCPRVILHYNWED